MLLIDCAYIWLLNWRDEPLSVHEELELQKMNWAGPKPKNRGVVRDIWERYVRNNGQTYNLEIDLYHMTSIRNLESILTHGLLSEYEIKNLGIVPDHISNHSIVNLLWILKKQFNF